MGETSKATNRDPIEKVNLQGFPVIMSMVDCCQFSHSINEEFSRVQFCNFESGTAMECARVITLSKPTVNTSMSNICWEGLTTKGTRAWNSGPLRIGLPRFSRIRHGTSFSTSKSGNASVSVGVICFSSDARSKKASDGLSSSIVRPATIVSGLRNMKEQLPHQGSTCEGGGDK